jgi:ATP-dependent Lhr-like helicase
VARSRRPAIFWKGRSALGVIPTQETLVLERFFDEAGGMQLVLHAPFGSRINKAWTLALRKRFCRQFNFELQAAATEDALLLSLGPQHSFPLADVFRYLHPATTRDILVQALLDAPVFKTRWRWNTTISLAVPRRRGGAKGAAAAAAHAGRRPDGRGVSRCRALPREHPGDREVPTIRSSTRRCATASKKRWIFDGLVAVLDRIHAGELRCVARDTPEPSAFAHEILNAKPYAFMDDAPLEERRRRRADAYAKRRGRQRDAVCSTQTPSSAYADEERPIRATRTNCTTRCSQSDFSVHPRSRFQPST